MTPTATQSEAFARSTRMLRTALGSAIAAFLEDPVIVEVMLNPDGKLWVDRLTDGLAEVAGLTPLTGDYRVLSLTATGDFS